MTKVLNDLLGYKNFKIYQDPDLFSFSLDSVLLPNFITINKNVRNILDIGCGNAPIPLILSTKTNADIIGVEIQEYVSILAKESVKINKKENQIKIINKDINELYEKIESDYFDIITCNPPFFNTENILNMNESEYKTIARHEVKLNLEQIMKISKKMLKNNGILGIVHRPERLVEILLLMKKNNIEPKRIRFVYPKKGRDAKILLIEGRKNGNPGLTILEPLYVHNENGVYTEEVKKFFE